MRLERKNLVCRPKELYPAKQWEAMGTRILFYEDYSDGVSEGELEDDEPRGKKTIRKTITVFRREMGLKVDIKHW